MTASLTADPVLDVTAARDILSLAGVTGDVAVAPVRTHNHVWRLSVGEGGAQREGEQTFFLKTHTKHWYAGNPQAPAGCVRHEAAAYEALAAHGLPTPPVALAAVDADNPLRRPFLLTRGLPGAPLTRWAGQAAAGEGAPALQDVDDLAGALRAVGAYLRRMHAITFRFPGYLMTPEGPAAPPAAGRWQHAIWTAEARQAQALDGLEAQRGALQPALFGALREHLQATAGVLAPDYSPPRFTHGDCHAHQFFVSPPVAGQDGPWVVHGVVDMEVASAGDAVQDLVKLAIEAAVALPAAGRWWEPLFAGYGGAPDFERFRLRLLSVGRPSFAWLRPQARRPSWEAVLRHLLHARTWDELFRDGW